jgi:3-oxoacyl-[acyl-carrier protein] reductase
MATGGRLEGRVAVVTGAARSFGRAIAARFVQEGARVALWDVDARVHDALPESPDALPLVVDVGDRDAVEAAAARTREGLGPIGVLVNNAAVVESSMPWEVTAESWSRHFRVNSDGAFWCVQACLPDMLERRYGKIVNIASVAALSGSAGASPAYAASKGALLGLTVSLARNLGEYGICVNAINPGFIRTEIHAAFDDDQLARFAAQIPLNRGGEEGRRGGVEDIAGAALYLASPDSDYVSGAFLSVNGAQRTA